jgi:hypothetical protein
MANSHFNIEQSRSGQSVTNEASRWEIGSEFHWVGLSPAPFIAWPRPARWYALGRHALVALVSTLNSRPRLRVWVPDYFCHSIVEYWGRCCEIMVYEDDPRWPEPNWESLYPALNDVVVAVNYFGMRDGTAWNFWRERNPCILMEDHSHDPVSVWALSSTADYAFSSLRKTLPVPDGAILWSPRGRPLPAQPLGQADGAVTLKLGAMIWKAEYLAGSDYPGLKRCFRSFQLHGEGLFDETEVCSMSLFSSAYLEGGYPAVWRKQRIDNLSELLRTPTSFGLEYLFSKCGPGSAPLCAVTLFESQTARDKCRSYLQYRNIYCPVHWPVPVYANSRVRELASRILSVPVDQRYTPADMRKVSKFLATRSRLEMQV